MALADYIYNKPTIETDRIMIRPMTIEDVTDLKEWMPDISDYGQKLMFVMWLHKRRNDQAGENG